jgi:hypothetical protein
VPPSTVALGSLAGLLVLGTSCEPKCERTPPGPDGDATGEGQRPRLVDGEFASSTVVELAFSEPLAPVDAVDPEKFRLGIVVIDTHRENGRCFRDIRYCDLSSELDSCGGYFYSYGSNLEPTRVTALELDEDDPSRLQLRITPPISQERCLQLESSEHKNGIQVFFSKGDEPTITDLDGEKLDDIAPHWVLSGDLQTTTDDFDALERWVALACPESF